MEVITLDMTRLDDDLRKAAKNLPLRIAQAVNKSTDASRAQARRDIEGEIAYPSGYLTPGAGRLTTAKKATSADPSATIRGRFRPTSLSRFVTSGRPAIRGVSGKGGSRPTPISLVVKPGKASFSKRMFLIKLQSGSGEDGKFNLGVAIRLKPGEVMRNRKIRAVAMGGKFKGLFLLYGPSVSQALEQVAGQRHDQFEENMAEELERLLQL
mgnify:CR=1 FL=1